jgi:hypothetical protein
MMAFEARYDGTCCHCDAPITVGQMIKMSGKQYRHVCCPPIQDDEPEMFEDKQRRIDNAEYAKGYAEGKQYSSDVKTYGRELADQWEMDAEMARYNRGEDY